MTDEALAAEWQIWVCSALIRGRAAEEIADALVAEGLPIDRARVEVEALRASPGVIAARTTLRPVSLAHRLRRAHLRLASREVPVRRGLDRRALYDECVAAQLPVLLPDLTEGWPARDWTWEGLAERFGDRSIQVCEGRAGAERPDRNYRSHLAMRPFRDVVRRVLDPATGNDLYVVANNEALEGPLADLLGDVGPAAAALDPERLTTSSAWIGPAGARTPLHHDRSDVMFCPFLGAKRVRLVPPEEVELADFASGFWAKRDLDDRASMAELGLEEAAVREVIVRPGESLLIPSGWWHEVLCLEPSITLTFAGLWHANTFPWFHPAEPDDLDLTGHDG